MAREILARVRGAAVALGLCAILMARTGQGTRQSLGLDAPCRRKLSGDADALADKIEDFAVKRFKRGQLSAKDVEEARAMSGRSVSSHAGNAHRKVINQLRHGSQMPDVYEAYIDLWDYDSQCKAQYKVYFLLPYEVFDA